MSERLYSLKRRRRWLWRTRYSREQILDLIRRGALSGDWMVCPIGQPDRAIDVEVFAADTTVLDESSLGQRSNADGGSELDESSIIFFGLCLAVFNLLAIPIAMVAGSGFAIAWISIVLGAICAEAGLVAAWFVFSSAAFQTRLVVGGAVGLAAYFLLFAGMLGQGSIGTMALVSLFVLLAHAPAVFLVIQLPMWMMRIWGRCGVIRPTKPLAGSYLHLIGIRELLVATAAIGVVLAILRAATSWASAYSGWNQQAFQVLLYVVAGAAIASPLTVTPMLVLVLGLTRIRWVLAGLLVWFLVLASLAAFLLASAPRESLFVLLGSLAVFGGVTCVGLVLVRKHGYRLVRLYNVTQDAKS